MQQEKDFSKLDILRLKEAHEKQAQLSRIRELSNDYFVNYKPFLDKYSALDKNGNSIELECETVLPLLYRHKFDNVCKILTNGLERELRHLQNEFFPESIDINNIKAGKALIYKNEDLCVMKKWFVRIDVFNQQAIFVFELEAKYKDFPATSIKYDMDLKQMRSAILGNPIKHEYTHYIDISNGFEDVEIENPQGLIANALQNAPTDYDFRNIDFYGVWVDKLKKAFDEKFGKYKESDITFSCASEFYGEKDFTITAKVLVPKEVEVVEKRVIEFVNEYVEVVIRLDWTLPQILKAINEKRTNKYYKEAAPYVMPYNLFYVSELKA